MPLLAGAEFLALFEQFILFLIAYEVFKWLVETFVGRIPFVGGRLANAAIAIGDAIERRIEHWLSASIHTMVHWFAVLATRIAQFPSEVANFADTVDQALEHLVTRKVPALVAAGTLQLRLDVAWLKRTANTLVSAVDAIPAYVDHKVATYGHALAHTLTQQFNAGIDRLYRDKLEPEFVGIEHGLRDLGKLVDAAETEGRAAARALSKEIGALAKRLDIPVSVIETLIATVGVAAAVDALDALAKCSPKLRMLCTTSPQALADLLAGLVMLAAWPGLYALTEEVQGIVGDVAGELHSLIVDGVTL